MLAGKPLIVWTIEAAQRSALFDAITVSSDSQEILQIAHDCGIRWIIDRPKELALDSAPKLPVVVHAVGQVETAIGRKFDTVVDLDPTSPLRSGSDIAGALALFDSRAPTNVITGTPARRSPYFNLVERDGSGFVRLCKSSQNTLARRQDSPDCFDMNASIYIWRRDALMANPRVFYDDTLLYVMPEERSHDIDSEIDFRFVEFLMADCERRSDGT